MNRDFVEMLSALSEAGAEYLVVGAHALAHHGRPRATGDLDIWIRPTSQNVERVWEALRRFGAPLEDLTQEELTRTGFVYQIGVPPVRIDLLSSLSGLEFDGAWRARSTVHIGSLAVPILGKLDLIRNKRAVGRPRDLLDADELERS